MKRFGYAGESNPRGIIRTEVKCPETREIRQVFSYKNTEDLYQLLVEFLHLLFFRYDFTFGELHDKHTKTHNFLDIQKEINNLDRVLHFFLFEVFIFSIFELFVKRIEKFN